MIFNSLIERVFSLVAVILMEILQDLNFDTLASHFSVLSSYFLDIVAYLFYFLPVIYLLPIFAVVGVIISVRFFIALCRLVLEIASFIGSFIG